MCDIANHDMIMTCICYTLNIVEIGNSANSAQAIGDAEDPHGQSTRSSSHCLGKLSLWQGILDPRHL